MNDGFVRVAAATPEIRVADCFYNARSIVQAARAADGDGAALVVFPELCLTARTCGDLFFQQSLLQDALEALSWIARETANLSALLVLGLPVRWGDSLRNAAAALHRGRVLGVVPKLSFSSRLSPGDSRYFRSGPALASIAIINQTAPFGWKQLFYAEAPRNPEMAHFAVGIEIGEDLWTPHSPSTWLTQAGATIIAHPAGLPAAAGRAELARRQIQAHAGKNICGYVSANSGCGESTTDYVFDGHGLIAENGKLLAESKAESDSGLISADLDVQLLAARRLRHDAFHPMWLADASEAAPAEMAAPAGNRWQRNHFFPEHRDYGVLRRPLNPRPFVPPDADALARRCAEVLQIQTAGLARRLRYTQAATAVLGLSGGLDSTLAFLVTVAALDRLGLDRKKLVAVTMPGFGTTGRTKGNAEKLAEAYGATLRVIPIHEAVERHFLDIGHDPSARDITYENAQARERTQALMDIANQTGGLMVGTGDLSELALGWATYNGDHMSMYAVNASVPKTLMRHLVAWHESSAPGGACAVLRDIAATPISPELLPADPRQGGAAAQSTEALLGPYEAHDFFLYHTFRHGFRPAKILRLAAQAFSGQYAQPDLERWLREFFRRFLAQQYKRSCSPDGPAAGEVSLSPRGGWLAPSDAEARAWLASLEPDKPDGSPPDGSPPGGSRNP